MERVLNAGPIPRWIGRQQPDANIRLVPRARTSAQKLRQTGLLNQHVQWGYDPLDDHHHSYETGMTARYRYQTIINARLKW